jgi:hypothetical protein
LIDCAACARTVAVCMPAMSEEVIIVTFRRIAPFKRDGQSGSWTSDETEWARLEKTASWDVLEFIDITAVHVRV